MSELLKEQADKIRMDMIMGAAEQIQDDLNRYSDEAIINSKSRTIRIKTRII